MEVRSTGLGNVAPFQPDQPVRTVRKRTSTITDSAFLVHMFALLEHPIPARQYVAIASDPDVESGQ